MTDQFLKHEFLKPRDHLHCHSGVVTARNDLSSPCVTYLFAVIRSDNVKLQVNIVMHCEPWHRRVWFSFNHTPVNDHITAKRTLCRARTNSERMRWDILIKMFGGGGVGGFLVTKPFQQRPKAFLVKSGFTQRSAEGRNSHVAQAFGAFTDEKKPNESRLFVSGLKVTLTRWVHRLSSC